MSALTLWRVSRRLRRLLQLFLQSTQSALYTLLADSPPVCTDCIATPPPSMSPATNDSSTTLFDLLSNSLILYQLVPYLEPTALVALSKTSRTGWNLVHHTPKTFRHLDLSLVPAATRVHVQNPFAIPEYQVPPTADEFYNAPLRNIFEQLGRRNILKDVQTLVLDGLPVTAELVSEIISDERYGVRILSIRDVKMMNENRLMEVLCYAGRESRPHGMPRLKGLYYFGPKDDHDGQFVNGLGRDPDAWFKPYGKLMAAPSRSWAVTVQRLRGIIAFDAVVCRGPRHDIVNTAPDSYLPPAIANVALGREGCERCLSIPECHELCNTPPAERIPLLSPPPLHTSTVKAAITPSFGASPDPTPFLRCEACMRDRWCERCHRWWCEDCFPNPSGLHKHEKMGVARDCFECGRTCHHCKDETDRRCTRCGGGYCYSHDDGSDAHLCDWCNMSGRRTREVFWNIPRPSL